MAQFLGDVLFILLAAFDGHPDLLVQAVFRIVCGRWLCRFEFVELLYVLRDPAVRHLRFLFGRRHESDGGPRGEEHQQVGREVRRHLKAGCGARGGC